MKRYIGIDGGGTKTEAVMIDENGNLLGHALGGASNLTDVGFEKGMDIITELVDKMGTREVNALFAGLSGGLHFRDNTNAYLKNIFPDYTKIDNGSDAENILAAGLGFDDGVGIISGTGSICYIQKNREMHRIGGWGHLVDEAGSGYDLGRDAINAALRQCDGRGEKTILSDMIVEFSGGTAWDRIIDFYDNGKKYIASFAPLVFKAYRLGDPMAVKILKKSAMAIVEFIDTSANFFEGDFNVTLAGSILVKDPEMADIVKTECNPHAKIEILTKAPAYGAAFRAAHL